MGASRSADVRGDACGVFKRALLHRSTAGAEPKSFEADPSMCCIPEWTCCRRAHVYGRVQPPGSSDVSGLGRWRHEALLARDTISPKRANSEEGTGFPFAVNLCGVGPTCVGRTLLRRSFPRGGAACSRAGQWAYVGVYQGCCWLFAIRVRPRGSRGEREGVREEEEARDDSCSKGGKIDGIYGGAGGPDSARPTPLYPPDPSSCWLCCAATMEGATVPLWSTVVCVPKISFRQCPRSVKMPVWSTD